MVLQPYFIENDGKVWRFLVNVLSNEVGKTGCIWPYKLSVSRSHLLYLIEGVNVTNECEFPSIYPIVAYGPYF